MVAFLKDRRGATTIQFLLIVPILLVLVIGGTELWKMLHVKQTMNDAAYQAVRLVAMQPNHGGGDIRIQAAQLVRRYISTNPYVDPRLRADPDDQNLLRVRVDYDSLSVGAEVEVVVQLYWVVGRDWGVSEWIPFLGRGGWLETTATGWVLGEEED